MKRCSHCRETKSLDDFHRNSRNPDGRHMWCKDCRSTLGKAERATAVEARTEDAKLVADGRKRCTSCREVKLLDQFYRKSASRDGRKSQCTRCYRASQAEYLSRPEAKAVQATSYRRRRDEDPAAWAARQRAYQLKSQYGISVDDYDARFVEQDGRCAVCRRAAESETALRVDHDHETGVVRGLLCHLCNSGIGMLGDTVDGLLSAVAYLLGPEVEAERSATLALPTALALRPPASPVT